VIKTLLNFVEKKTLTVDTLDSGLAVFLNTKKLQDLLPCNDYSQTSAEQKVLILWNIIEKINEDYDEEISDFLNEKFSPDQLRATCVGQDAFCNNYWYFDDLRLYKEHNSGHPKKPWAAAQPPAISSGSRKDWSCVCVSLDQWTIFLKQFRKSGNPNEKALYSLLKDEIFPLVKIQLEVIRESYR